MISNFFRQKFILFLCVILLVPAQAGSFTIGEEKEVGEKLLYSIRSVFPVLDDPDLHDYINGLGQEVLEVAGFQYFDYRFYIVESKDFNAFAAPSGLIFFYTGLIETMNTEDELVSVLAHEIGHVAKRHIASRMEKGAIVNIASLGLALASLALGDAKATAAVFTSSIAAGQAANLQYSRDNEEEADLLAYDWMKELERSPIGQEKMLQTMRRISRYKQDQIPQYLLTHPNPEFRLDYVQGLIETEGNVITPEQSKTHDFEFLRFKYRILSKQDNTSPTRQYLISTISRGKKSDKKVIMAKYGLSQLDRQEKNYENSLNRLNEVIAAFPDKDILKIDKAVLLLEAGDQKNAISLLEKLYRKNPNDNYVTFSLAQAYLNAGNLDKAEHLFIQVSHSMEEYSKVFYELGRISSLKKKNGDTHYYLGKYNLYEGKLKLARMSFKKAERAKDLNKEYAAKIPDYMKLLEKLLKK